MIGMENKVLRSQRLTYRLLDAQDREPLARILSDQSVTEPAGFLPAESEAQFDDFFTTLTQYRTGIAILLGDTLIGYIRVNRYVADAPTYQGKKGVSTGFVIGKPYQNQGYATETLATITAYLKQRFDYCVADHFADNEASRRVIEKCGYQYLETYTMFFEELGKDVTCLSYVR